MNYEDIIKIDKQYKVKKNIFEKEFADFEKVYPGYLINERSGVKTNLPAWRAFEVEVLHGNNKSKTQTVDERADRGSSKKSGKFAKFSRNKSSSDSYGSPEIDTESRGSEEGE